MEVLRRPLFQIDLEPSSDQFRSWLTPDGPEDSSLKAPAPDQAGPLGDGDHADWRRGVFPCERRTGGSPQSPAPARWVIDQWKDSFRGARWRWMMMIRRRYWWLMMPMMTCYWMRTRPPRVRCVRSVSELAVSASQVDDKSDAVVEDTVVFTTLK
jgi:hypothetical protein